ncbi:hypothetical protein PIIN_06231 [Serendipita indica DSM 11827]|uniref:Nudix hydrolase domain-containing protein n=1 Tax=Serendipita indica (strain DSM 11827) TaxID=1109443 RepID=G4TLV4_SERID|nr:hypothetical protein PIIN_06231 [Serendipita indica DSM 11827]
MLRWASGAFQLSAGCVMIQPSTGKLVVVQDAKTKQWFLPRGRKDVGETLEQAAFREGYEESGYKPEPLPLLLPHRQPPSPEQVKRRKENPNDLTQWLTTTEPVYITTMPVRTPRRSYEYHTFWYAASIPADAVREENTGMEDEKDYIGKLLSLEEAVNVLGEPENYVVWFTHETWKKTEEQLKEN